jgi:Flp pilus assembly protein TadD
MGLLAKGATGEALALARRLAEASPQNIDVRQLLAICLTRSGNIADAEREFRHALRLSPSHPPVLANLATLLRSQGRLPEAIPLWRRATSIDPKFLQAWIDLGAAELSDGQNASAAEAFEKAIALQPSSRTWHYLGNARRALGQLLSAERAFRNAIALDAKSATAWINLGAVSRLLGKPGEAIACYEQAEALGYDKPELRDALIGALIDDGNVAAATQHARLLVTKHPEFAPGHRTFADLLWEYGPTVQATEEPFSIFARAAEAQPDNLPLQHAYLSFLLETDKAHEALDHIEHLRKQYDSPQLVLMHASAFDKIGQYESATRLYADRYRQGDRSLPLLNAYTRNLLVSGEWATASATAAEANQLDPSDQQALANLATAWRLLGDSREFWLCDYEHLIYAIDVEVPSELGGRDEFLGDLNATLDTMHLAAREPILQSLRGGSQTPGQLFGRPIALIESTRQIMQRTAMQWLSGLPDDPAHPFLQRNSGRVRFAGSWSVKLWTSGRHVNHIHSHGWISSAFYVKLPPSVQAGTSTNAGCIQFGQPPLDMGLNLEPRRVLRPQPGRLVLFPSYLWHGTVPFDDAEPRVTVAFDLLPSTDTGADPHQRT